MIIQRLLNEAGVGGIGDDLVSVDARGLEVAADWGSLKSPENYVGYERTQGFASPGGAVRDKPRMYELPARLRLNEWGLSGDWTLKNEATALNKPNGRIAYRFHARDLHLVMGPAAPGTSVRFRVMIDGQPPGAAHGLTLTSNATDSDRAAAYQLIRRPKPIANRQFEIISRSRRGSFAFTSADPRRNHRAKENDHVQTPSFPSPRSALAASAAAGAAIAVVFVVLGGRAVPRRTDTPCKCQCVRDFRVQGIEDWPTVAVSQTRDLIEVIPRQSIDDRALPRRRPRQRSLSPTAPRWRSSTGTRKRVRRPPSRPWCRTPCMKVISW